MEQKRIWNIIHESDDENPNGLYDVIDSDAETLLKICQSLRSAKRWVSMNLL